MRIQVKKEQSIPRRGEEKRDETETKREREREERERGERRERK